MKALRAIGPKRSLILEEVPMPVPGNGAVLVKVAACGVCRTDLHLVDGELALCRYPVTPGHEVVGTVVDSGSRFASGARVGIPWLGWTCGECEFCRRGRENLCERARFTGCHNDGGYAQYLLADERFCLPIPARYGDAQAAPLLCAGLIGYRGYRFAGEARVIGLYGFGAAAHILAQVARAEGRTVFAFTREKDLPGQQFARDCGAHWAGDAGEAPPEPLDAAIVFAPAGPLVVEGEIVSVANLTRADGERFMQLAARLPLRTQAHPYPLERANEALDDLRAGRFAGAAVLVP